MALVDEIPPEILAFVFEVGIHTTGIQSLIPLALVCRNWRDIINSTPRLWGIISASKNSSPAILEKQIAKAKASPLTITIENIARNRKYKIVVQNLQSLYKNWVSLQVGTDFLYGLHLVDLQSLKSLSLSNSQRLCDTSQGFFSPEPGFPPPQSRLQFFEARALPREWIIGFLSPSILFFRIVGNLQQADIGNTWTYLLRARNAITIELESLNHFADSLIRLPPTIHLNHLTNLRLKKVRKWPLLLSSIAAPLLQTLSIDQSDNNLHLWRQPWSYYGPHYYNGVNHDEFTPSSLFSQWSDPTFLPTSLHTLELFECLGVDDIPYLIHWLARLPNLVRLSIQDSEKNALQNGSLYTALSSPQVWGIPGQDQPTWLCPSLMILSIDARQEILDLLPIALARGGRASAIVTESLVPAPPPPARLRLIEARLCVTGEQKDID